MIIRPSFLRTGRYIFLAPAFISPFGDLLALGPRASRFDTLLLTVIFLIFIDADFFPPLPLRRRRVTPATHHRELHRLHDDAPVPPQHVHQHLQRPLGIRRFHPRDYRDEGDEEHHPQCDRYR